CLRRLGRLDEAGARLERLLARDAGAIAARLELGVLQQERDQLDAAIATYRAVLAAQPAQLEALNNLGVCLRQAGALDEARVAFEQVLAASPHRIETHCNLAQLKTYAADDPQVGHLLSLRHRLPGLPAHGRIRYWFSVGKMLEDGGRHDEAFAAYAEGNRLKHAQAPWDEAGHEEAMRRIAGTFSPAWIARSPDACGAELPAGEGLAAHDTGGRVGEVDDRAAGGAAGPIPVFVVGMPRSGTSLIEQVLATLPGVHGAGELTDLPDVLQAAAADHPAGDYRFPETPAGYDDDRLRRLGRRYLERLRVHAPAATHIVDKLPANFAHLGLLHRMLPQARIVHAMRDPMDACFSCFSRLFAADNLAFTYELGALGRYWVTYHRLMRHWHAVLPLGRILDLPYEAMVTDFEAQARRLVAHLGLPWDERCLGFHRNRRVVGTASAAQVRRPIYRSSVARWKAFERHLGPLMDIVGPYR
ncbi:MAG TPA: sulfotransferase, partial [Burkholderiaceae bacterium]